MQTPILIETIEKMMTPGKGVLAIDESNGTADKKRLAPIGVNGTPENRRRFRELFLDMDGNETFLSGVILYDETLKQSNSDEKPFVDILADKDIVIGIKVDEGAKDSDEFPGEKITAGIDGLDERLAGYYELGARFAKWRAVITIDTDSGLPTDGAIRKNAEILARYAELCHKNNIVPMIEPEVLLQGSHKMDIAEQVTGRTLTIVFEELDRRGVDAKYVILKTSMVVPGDASGELMESEKVGATTVRMLNNSIPQNIGGVVFLSGGQTSEQATENLDAIADEMQVQGAPWMMTFSFSRAIEMPVLEAWAGKDENVAEAQEIYVDILKRDAWAQRGML
ncbi:MAG: fructose-bisphosphate aldolase class I [Candidatus Nomurabacteria bacterium]|nr:fructose-bisphosphate aldolase class I [Candidatus Nomurabacteria bacterium]